MGIIQIKKSILVFCLVLIAGIVSAYAQTKICFAGHERELNDGLAEKLKANGYVFVQMIYEEAIDPEHVGILNPDLLRKKVEELYPNKNAQGYACLNWETPVIDRVYFGTEKEQRETINQLLQAIDLLKQLRPGIKWGYYGLNRQEYYNRNADWKARSARFKPVISACDVFYPSLYQFYPSSVNGEDFEHGYARENTALNLALYASDKIEIIPFVWNRWHDADKKYGLQSIAPSEFSRHVNDILTTVVDGRKVSSVALWGMDAYYTISSDVVKREMGSTNAATYRVNNAMTYLGIIDELVEKQ